MASHRDELPEGKKGNVLDRSAAPQRFENPGMPPHAPRTTDVDPQAAKRAERQVVLLFVISILGSILFFVVRLVITSLATEFVPASVLNAQQAERLVQRFPAPPACHPAVRPHAASPYLPGSRGWVP